MISNNISILTNDELDARENAAFQRGVTRGRFEERWDISHGKSPQVVIEVAEDSKWTAVDGEQVAAMRVVAPEDTVFTYEEIKDGVVPAFKALLAIRKIIQNRPCRPTHDELNKIDATICEAIDAGLPITSKLVIG